jgi:hypothetical protein
MSRLNEEWAGNVLNMAVQRASGPDLVHPEKLVEIKFSLCRPNRENDICWTAYGDQWNYDQHIDKPIYWGLGVYWIDTRVASLRSSDPITLNKHVTHRRLTIVPWAWSEQFKVSSCRTHDYLYLRPIPQEDHLLPLPSTIRSLDVSGGELHFTEGVDLRLFSDVLGAKK